MKFVWKLQTNEHYEQTGTEFKWPSIGDKYSDGMKESLPRNRYGWMQLSQQNTWRKSKFLAMNCSLPSSVYKLWDSLFLLFVVLFWVKAKKLWMDYIKKRTRQMFEMHLWLNASSQEVHICGEIINITLSGKFNKSKGPSFKMKVKVQ